MSFMCKERSMFKGRAKDYLILLVLWLLVFSAGSQTMIISPMLPQIGSELNVPEAIGGTLVSAYTLMVGIFALVIGPVSDKIGRRRILLLGSGLMSLALVLHGAATSYWMLLLMRAVAGVAGGVLSGAAVSYIGDYFPDERRGWASGWIMSSTALGQILGVPLGTLLAARYGFRLPFLLFAATMTMTFLMVWKFIPQPRVKRLEGALTVRHALGNYLRLLRRREVKAAALAFGLMLMSIALYITYLPTWLVATHGTTAAQIATLFFIGGIAGALTGPIAGQLSDRAGRKLLIVSSSVGLSLTMFFTIAVEFRVWFVYPLFFLAMLFFAARMSPFQALLSSLATGDQRGSLLSLSVALGQVGFSLGGAIARLAYTQLGYASNAVGGAFCALLMVLLVWRYLPESRHEKQSSVAHGAEERKRLLPLKFVRSVRA